jgi:ATP/maltotriose-dependent transcriptional regulator MalT
VLAQTASFYQGRGDFARAHAYLEEALALLERLAKRDVHLRCAVYGGWVWYHLQAGDYVAAERYAGEAIKLVDAGRAYPIYLFLRTGLPALAEAQIELGELDDAERTLDRLIQAAGEFGHKPALASGHRLRGRLRLLRGQTRDGLIDLRTAVDAWRELKQPYELGRALRDRGQARLTQGNRNGGGDLQEAREIFELLGAERDASAVRQILRTHGIRAQRRPTSQGRHPGGLTDREVEIVRLAIDGLTNRQIAEQLFISPLTAETHLRNVLRKLSLHSRAQLGDYATLHDLL